MEKRLFLLFLSFVLLTAYQSSGQLSSGLVAYYPFGGTADDMSGNLNHGTPSGSVSLAADRFGTPGCAYTFAGDSSSYIRIPYMVGTLAGASSGEPVSISLWYKGCTPSTGDLEFLWAQPEGWATPSQTYLGLTLYDLNKASFGWAWESEITVDSLGANWHHIVGIYDAGNYSLYKDNVLIESIPGAPITPVAADFMIGRKFEGLIDDIRIYDRVISSIEIDSIYNLSGACAPTGTNALSALKNMAIYPNPSTGTVYLIAEGVSERIEVIVTNVIGEEKARFHISDKAVSKIDLTDQPSGIYFITLRSDQAQRTEPVQIVR